MFCKGDKLQHPSSCVAVCLLSLPKLTSVRTNHSTLSTADRHITAHSYSPQTVLIGGEREGGDKTNRATQHIDKPYIMLGVFHFRRMYCTAYIFMVTKLEQVDVEVM
jgi:hypothetical protein